MAALISSVMDTKDKVPFFVAQAEEMGIEILPPDVNLSDHEFIVVEGNIRFGLDAVKGVGYAAVEAIKAAREEGGAFTSLWDFCERVDGRAVNKRSIEALIKCGAFGSTGATRKGMLEVLEPAQAAGQQAQQDAQIGPGLDLRPVRRRRRRGTPRRSRADATRRSRSRSSSSTELLAMEKESIGLFISEHPLKEVREALRVKVDCSTAEVIEQRDGDWVKVGGIITEAKKIRTRKGTTMMFATLDDLEGSVEIVVFDKALAADEERARRRRDRARPRPRRPQGGRQDLRLVVQTSSASSRRDAEVEKARKAARAKPAGRRARAPSAARVDAARLPGDASSTTSSTCSRALPGRDRGRARHAHPHRRAARCKLRRRLPRVAARDAGAQGRAATARSGRRRL